MLKSYKNQIFEALKNHSIGVDNFIFEDNEKTFFITYNGGGPIALVFCFVSDERSFDYFRTTGNIFAPGYPNRARQSWMHFEEALIDFVKWLNNDLSNYISEILEVDLWSEHIKKDHLIPIKSEDYFNSDHFTVKDKQSLNLSINELKLLIVQKFELDEAHQKIVEGRLDYLSKSLERSTNKTDWKGILINTMISISIALSLDTQKGQELYGLFVAVMQVMPGLNN